MKISLSVSLLLVFPFILYGQFTEVGILSDPRSHVSTAVFDNTILFLGGSGNKVDYFNANNFQLSSEQYASDGFSRALMMQNNRFAIFYNLSGVNLLSVNMYVYDDLIKQWYQEKYPDGASQEMENGYIISNKAIFFDNNDQDQLYTFDLLTRKWGTIPSLFTKRETVIHETENKIFFIGGKESFTVRSDSVHVYNKDNSTWDAFALNEARNGVTAVQYNDKIVIAGGQSSNVNPNTSTDLVEIIDINDYSIETLNLSKRKNNLVGVAVGNKVIFAGGNSKKADVINMDDLTLTTHDFNVNKNLKHLNGGVLDQKAVFAGGNDVDGDQVFVYDAEINSWSNFTIDEARSNMAFVSVNDKLFVAGGENDSENKEFDEIFLYENNPSSGTEINSDHSVGISPNPASDFLKIHLENHKIKKIIIRDFNGRIINTFNNPEKILNVTNLKFGVYLISLHTYSKVYTQKIIKI